MALINPAATITHDLTFYAAPGTTDGAELGYDAQHKAGFYGTVPIAQPTITAANSAPGTAGGVLVALGLALQSG